MKKVLFPVGFMVSITVIFIAILAGVNAITSNRILKNSQIEELKSILYAFQIYPKGIDGDRIANSSTTNDLPWNEEEVFETFQKRIRPIYLPLEPGRQTFIQGRNLRFRDSIKVWVHFDSLHRVLAYGFKMQGKGLWGTIIAFGTVTRNLNRMVGLDFMQQVETPGLGARITEHEFKHYFCNLNLEGFDQNIPETPQIVMVRKKERTNREESTNELQAITGATQTCNGVLQMVNRDLKFYLNLISKNRDFIDGQLQRNDG